jgi:hypothetical protein
MRQCNRERKSNTRAMSGIAGGINLYGNKGDAFDRG